MDAKSIYEELLKQGIPEKLVTWSNKADSIDILIQDYNEKVYKEALKFFKGYEGVRVDYTIDHETALWCDDVSKYSSDELIRSITDFYYTLRAKGLAYTESKESVRKSIKESADNINNTAYFDRVAGELHSWYVCYVEDYERKYEYGFKNEKECINWIKKNGFDLDPSMIESKKSARKSIEEKMDSKSEEIYYLLYRLFELNLIQTNDYDEDQFDEITDYIEKNGVDKLYKNEAYKLAMQYINHNFSNGKEYKEIIKKFLDLFGLQVNTHSVEWNIISESKKSARKSIKESTINTLDDVEFKLLDIAKNYGIAMEGSSKGLLFLNKEVSPNLIKKLNDKYYDEYSPYPPYLLAMKELLFEYDKGFSKFMDVYSKIK